MGQAAGSPRDDEAAMLRAPDITAPLRTVAERSRWLDEPFRASGDLPNPWLQPATTDGDAASDPSDRLTLKLFEMAAAGDVAALAMVMERALATPTRPHPLELELPPIVTADGAFRVMGDLVTAVSNGDLGVDSAGHLATVVETLVRALDAREIGGDAVAVEPGPPTNA